MPADARMASTQRRYDAVHSPSGTLRDAQLRQQVLRAGQRRTRLAEARHQRRLVGFEDLFDVAGISKRSITWRHITGVAMPMKRS